MSKLLATTLHQPQELASGLINKLEALSSYSAVDLRFDSEAKQTLKSKISQLGLDPKDTTSEELYWALAHRFAETNEFFEKTYGSGSGLRVVADLTENTSGGAAAWALKPVAIKKLLRKNPPKALMKHLGYRSLESMLKHEDVPAVMAVSESYCSRSWNDHLQNDLKKLPPTDYEERAPSVVALTEKWKSASAGLPAIIASQSTAVIVLPDNASSRQLPMLSYFVVSAQMLESLRLASLVAKIKRSSSQLESGHSFLAGIGGAALSWNSLLFHFGRSNSDQHPEVFEPHITPEHLDSRSLNERICNIHPMFGFWKDSDSLLKGKGNRQVSANIVDVAANFANNASFGENTTQAGRSAYWNHLLHRYMQHPAVFDKIITEIENSLASGYQEKNNLVTDFAEVENY